jgi:hypothetical protein
VLPNQQILQADVQYHLARMLERLMALKKRFTPQEVATQLPVEERQRLVEPYSGFMVGVDYLPELRAALRETGLHVVAREEAEE